MQPIESIVYTTGVIALLAIILTAVLGWMESDDE